MPTLKVVTYNIHKGFSAGNRRFVLHDIRRALQQLDPDVLLLQEVHGDKAISGGRFDDWHNNCQFEFLADALWPHHAYGKNAVYQGGHHGNVILSKYPLTAWRNIDVSYMKKASRSLLHAQIEAPAENGARRIHLVCVHLGLLGIERERQLRKLRRLIHTGIDASEALIVAGDFNDWRGRAKKHLHRNSGLNDGLSDGLETGPETGLEEAFHSRNGRYARSYPARFPLLRMDRIYFRHLALQHSQVLQGPPWPQLSDHLPLLAEFSL